MDRGALGVDCLFLGFYFLDGVRQSPAAVVPSHIKEVTYVGAVPCRSSSSSHSCSPMLSVISRAPCGVVNHQSPTGFASSLVPLQRFVGCAVFWFEWGVASFVCWLFFFRVGRSLCFLLQVGLLQLDFIRP